VPDSVSEPEALRQGEALREALLELERLRQREARALRENAAVLGALSAMTHSDGPRAALDALLASVRRSLDADAALILRRRRRAEECIVEHTTDPALAGTGSVALATLTTRQRRIADLEASGLFAGHPCYAAYSSLIAAPIALHGAPDAAILCLSARRMAFGPTCLRLLARIADLAGSALDRLVLAERQGLLAAVIEGSSASISISDARGEDAPLIYVNPAFAALTGYSRDEVLFQNCRLLAADPPDGPERMRLRAAVAERRRGHFLLRNRRKDGTLFWNQLDLDAVPGEGAQADFLVATQIDVSDRIEAQDGLQRMNDRLAVIAAVSDTWFWEFDAELRWSFLSEPVERIVGLRREDVIGRRLQDLAEHPSYAGLGDWDELLRRILSLERIEGFTFRAPAAAGRDAVMRISGTPFFAPDGSFAGYRGVGADVTEIVRAKEQAEFASRAKSDFLATVSHELRTPLTAILGNVELLAPMVTDEVERSIVAEIDGAGRRLDAVLSDVIDLARLDNGRMSLERQRFLPRELLEKVARLHRADAEEKGLRLSCEGHGALDVPRLGDERRILQILHHLTANAVKFTRAGAVVLRARAVSPVRLVLEVADTGVGIARENHVRIFENFVHLDTRLGRTHGGSGLGLSICRQLVRLMAGEITLDSVPGQGTTVRVSLPVPAEVPAAAVAGADAAPAAPLSGLRILAADDTAANRKILSLMLGRLGAECTLATDGTEALAAWREGDFDIGLFDINMPGLDGVALVREIRAAEARDGRPRLPAIAVTANAMPHQVDAYREAGFDGCVGKPFSRETLLDTIWEQIAKMGADPAPASGAGEHGRQGSDEETRGPGDLAAG